MDEWDGFARRRWFRGCRSGRPADREACGCIHSSAAGISLRAGPTLGVSCGLDVIRFGRCVAGSGVCSLVIDDEIASSWGHEAHRERSVQRDPERMSGA